MNKPPAFQFYAQDFLTGVMYLTNEEKGIYITMLAKQWNDGKIPKKRLGFLVGLDWEKFSDELKDKFEDKGDYIVNIRLEKEREKQLNFREKQKTNGKKGGRPKKEKPLKPTDLKTQKPKPFDRVNPKQTQKNPIEDEGEDRSVKIEVVNEVDVEVEVYPTFDDFWNDYDKKVGVKSKIKKQWDKLSQKTKEHIISYVSDYKLAQPDKKYRKNPETFFNNQSWNDEIIISKLISKTDAQEFTDILEKNKSNPIATGFRFK